MWKSMLIVGLGSFAGGALRHMVSLLVRPVCGFPVQTFIVNLLGCLLIGFLYGLFSRCPSANAGSWCLLLTTGFCGGFTTFSTFANESLSMLQSGDCLTFALYAGLSLLLGILAVFCGYRVAGLIL